MILLNDKNIRVFILLANMLSQSVYSNKLSSTYEFKTVSKCPLPLTVMDFIYNFTQPDLEIIWPCEVRLYWLSLQPFVRFVRFLLAYVTPFIIILGILLNAVSFSMLSTPVLCDSNLSLYLSTLAISDNGALIFSYAVSIAKSHSTFINDLFMNSRFLCSTNSVSMELFQFTSTWLVVALTWTRVIAIMFPFGIRGCQNCSAVITIPILACISFIISLTKLYSGGYETDSVFEFIPCQKKIEPWGNAMYLYIALSTWLPLLFISIGNLLLIIRVRKSCKIHNELTHNTRCKSNRIHNSGRTLFAVSIVYLILLLPLGIVETLELYWDVILVKHPAINAEENGQYISWLQEKMLLKWCRGLFFHIYHWNFAINFFLYYLTGKKFRRVVIQTLRNYTNSNLLCYKNMLNCDILTNCYKQLSTVRFPSANNQLVANNITRSDTNRRI